MLAAGMTDREAIMASQPSIPARAFVVFLLGWVQGNLLDALLAPVWS
jgi:hypothetical protein